MLKINGNTQRDVMYFNNDDDFVQFCVKPEFVAKKSNKSDGAYFDIDYTDEYLDAVKRNVVFIIRDEDSVITKRGFINIGAVSKKISNVERYTRFDNKIQSH